MTLYWSLLLGLWRALWLVPLAAALAGPEPGREVVLHQTGNHVRPELEHDKTQAGVGMNAGVRRPYLRVVK